jgi:hypothetical protein
VNHPDGPVALHAAARQQCGHPGQSEAFRVSLSPHGADIHTQACNSNLEARVRLSDPRCDTVRTLPCNSMMSRHRRASTHRCV